MNRHELWEKFNEKLLFSSFSLLCVALVWWNYYTGEMWPIWVLIALVIIILIIIIKMCSSSMGAKAAGGRKMAEAAHLNKIGRDALHGDDFASCLNHAHYVIYSLKDVKSPRRAAFLMDAWVNLVGGYMGLNEYARAIVYGLEVLKQYESDARMHFFVGMSFQKLGAFLKAEEYLLKSIALNDGNQAAKQWLCFARMGLGKVEESTHLLHQLDESPGLPDIVERCLSHRLKAGYFGGFGDELAYWIGRYPGRQKLIEIQALHESQEGTLVEPETFIDDDFSLEKED